MSAEWYVLRIEPRAEYIAASELTRDGFEIYLPCLKVSHPRVGHTDDPLFPGYLLIRCHSESESWPTFRPGHRVLGWVKFGGEVPSLPEAAVTELRSRLEDINQHGGQWTPFRPGELVRIVSKSIQGFARVMETGKSPQARVRVLLDFMGREVLADVPWEFLRPAEDETRDHLRNARRTRGRGRWIRSGGSLAAAGG